MSKRICLNLGCGNDYRETTEEVEWINADKGKCRVDIQWDMEAGERPFSGLNPDYIDHIEAIQVLEHVSKEKFPEIIRELYRISKPDATWYVAVPHGFSDDYITDPTHKMPFSTRTFDYFVDGTPLRENGIIYGWGDVRLQYSAAPQMDGNNSIHFHLRIIK